MNALERQLAFVSSLGKDWNRASKQSLRLRLYGELMLLDCVAIMVAFVLAATVRSFQWMSVGGVNLALMIVPLYVGVALNI